MDTECGLGCFEWHTEPKMPATACPLLMQHALHFKQQGHVCTCCTGACLHMLLRPASLQECLPLLPLNAACRTLSSAVPLAAPLPPAQQPPPGVLPPGHEGGAQLAADPHVQEGLEAAPQLAAVGSVLVPAGERLALEDAGKGSIRTAWRGGPASASMLHVVAWYQQHCCTMWQAVALQQHHHCGYVHNYMST
jgi:hypothetical protein